MTDSQLLQAIYKDTQELKQRMSNVENKVTNIELMIENEINIREMNNQIDDDIRKMDNQIDDLDDLLSAHRYEYLERKLREIKEKLE